jgi:hypothetical protein
MFRQYSSLHVPMRMLMYANEEARSTHQAGDSQGSLQCFVHDLLLDCFDAVLFGSCRMVSDLFHSKVIRGVE